MKTLLKSTDQVQILVYCLHQFYDWALLALSHSMSSEMSSRILGSRDNRDSKHDIVDFEHRTTAA